MPAWVNTYYQNYYCTDSLIIIAAQSNYIKYNKSEELRQQFIGGGYMIDFKNMVQFRIDAHNDK